MMNKARTVVKQTIHNLGWDLRRFQPKLTSGGQTVSALTHTEINVVIDLCMCLMLVPTKDNSLEKFVNMVIPERLLVSSR